MMVEVTEDVYDVVGPSGVMQTFAALDDAQRASGQLRVRRVTRRVPGVFRVVDADGTALGDFAAVAAANTVVLAHPGARIVIAAAS